MTGLQMPVGGAENGDFQPVGDVSVSPSGTLCCGGIDAASPAASDGTWALDGSSAAVGATGTSSDTSGSG